MIDGQVKKKYNKRFQKIFRSLVGEETLYDCEYEILNLKNMNFVPIVQSWSVCECFSVYIFTIVCRLCMLTVSGQHHHRPSVPHHQLVLFLL